MALPLRDIITAIIAEHGGYENCSTDMEQGSYRAINKDLVDELADSVLSIVAELVATLIDAGSEREAVFENEHLRDAIRDELNEWSA